ncbi:unnamed protein product [Ixodes persulcatus]
MSPTKMFVLLTTFAAAVLTRSQAAAVPKTTPLAVLSTTQQPMGPFWGIWKRDLNAITSTFELPTIASATADSVHKRDASDTIGTSVPFRTFVTRDVEKREVTSSTGTTVEDVRSTAVLSTAPGVSLVPREADEEDDEAATKASSGKSSTKEVSERDDEDASEAQSSTSKASTSMVTQSTVIMATHLEQGAVTRGNVAEDSTAASVSTASESAQV